jgi:hypothetical protein
VPQRIRDGIARLDELTREADVRRLAVSRRNGWRRCHGAAGVLTMARWQPGRSGNPHGRPRGRRTCGDTGRRDRWREGLLDDESLPRGLPDRPGGCGRFIRQLESLIWQLVHGRPRQAVDVSLDAAVRAAPFEVRGPDGELWNLVVPGVGSFERRDDGFDFIPAEPPPAGLLRRRDDDDDS